MEEMQYDWKQTRKAFSRIGWAFCAILGVSFVLQLIWVVLPTVIWGEDNWATASSWGMWLGTFLPLYAGAIPIGLWILKKLPAEKPESHPLGTKNFFVFFAIGYCLMYGGSLIGNTLSSWLSGGNAENAVLDYAMDTNPLKVLFMVFLAPILEEYVCRKQVIDRTKRYGEKIAALLSAVIFGLLHQNLFQFFYAFGVGLVFAYIYLRTGRLRYTIGLHIIFNFMGSVIAPELLLLLETESVVGVMVYLLYILFLLGVSVAGLVLLIKMRKRLIWKEAQEPLPKGTALKTVYLNAGMILYMLLCTAFTVIALM